jgi:hypothetical protein
MNNNNLNNPHHLQPLRNNYHINPAESKLVYHNPKQYQPINPPNNYNQIPISSNYQQVQSRPLHPYQTENLRPNSFDNFQSNYSHQPGNVHHLHNSPPNNNSINRAVSYVNAPVFAVQPHSNHSNFVSQVHPVTHAHQDVRFNYGVSQPNYNLSSQPLYYQGKVVVNHSQENAYQTNAQQNTYQTNAQISVPPILQPTVQSGVQTSTVVTAVTIPPPNQTSSI